MISCSHARHLFDRYLDDELSPSLRTEVHTHVLQCTACQTELAILEACGDVIRLDRREPVPGPSFTDRVLAASRPMRQARAARSRRLPWLVGTPIAAAACLALVIWSQLGTLSGGQGPAAGGPTAATASHPPSVVASASIAAPVSVQKELTRLTEKKLSPEAEAELRNTPEMPALSFLDALLAPVMQGTRNAVEGTRQTAADLELLIRFGLAGMNEQLIADYRQRYGLEGPAPVPDRTPGDGVYPPSSEVQDAPASPTAPIQPAAPDHGPTQPI